MSTRWYPLYQRGNPQLRVYLPNFWMKLIKPKIKLPENVVHFNVSTEMTEFDVKNYLEKIYKVPVAAVKVEMKNGDIKILDRKMVKHPDYKIAYVTMARTEKFTFPDISFDSEEKLKEQYKQIVEQQIGSYDKRGTKTPTEPTWFM